ncbi:MAG: hypothetical protein EBZ91_13225 [Gammaproteobacteria bacterium]|jgi:hypothetical protein|nr:hypothetical protein [Gammaproteobacteria bacterium]
MQPAPVFVVVLLGHGHTICDASTCNRVAHVCTDVGCLCAFTGNGQPPIAAPRVYLYPEAHERGTAYLEHLQHFIAGRTFPPLR